QACTRRHRDLESRVAYGVSRTATGCARVQRYVDAPGRQPGLQRDTLRVRANSDPVLVPGTHHDVPRDLRELHAPVPVEGECGVDVACVARPILRRGTGREQCEYGQ